jgi:hypothetical protein
MVMMVIHRSGGLWGSKASFVSGLQDLRSMLDHCSTVLGRWSHRHSGWPGGNPVDPWCRSFGHTLDISRHPNRACANTMLLIWSLTPCECKRLLLRKKMSKRNVATHALLVPLVTFQVERAHEGPLCTTAHVADRGLSQQPMCTRAVWITPAWPAWQTLS